MTDDKFRTILTQKVWKFDDLIKSEPSFVDEIIKVCMDTKWPEGFMAIKIKFEVFIEEDPGIATVTVSCSPNSRDIVTTMQAGRHDH